MAATGLGLAARMATGALQMATLYVTQVGCVWTVGQFHLWLHGGHRTWFHALLIDHPWQTTAAMFAVCGPVALLLGRPATHAVPADEAAYPSPGRAPAPSWTTREGPPCTPEALHGQGLALADAAERLLGEARTLVDRARLEGSADAAHTLASWNARGIGIPRDEAAARAFLAEAAAAGHAQAAFDLGAMSESAIGGPGDPAAAYRNYLAAAAMGHRGAASEVARCLRDGIGTARDTAAASAIVTA